VVRFAEQLGLSGYTALQTLARQALREEVNTVSQLERASASQRPETLLSTSVKADIANLEQTLATVPEQTFAEAVDILASARIIHLLGLRSTFGLVQHFAFYLGWIGRRAHIIQPGIGDLPEQLMRVSSRDACVALSFRRYTRETVNIFRAIHNAGARTIALTDVELSPLTEHADLMLRVPVQSPSFYESRTAVLSLMNGLVFGIALRNHEDTVESLRKHELAWSQYATYSNESYAARFNAEIEAFAVQSAGRDRKAIRRAQPTRQKPRQKALRS
jgi:DNA-binding MurR/RpiR family transcriptional regulator